MADKSRAGLGPAIHVFAHGGFVSLAPSPVRRSLSRQAHGRAANGRDWSDQNDPLWLIAITHRLGRVRCAYRLAARRNPWRAWERDKRSKERGKDYNESPARWERSEPSNNPF